MSIDVSDHPQRAARALGVQPGDIIEAVYSSRQSEPCLVVLAMPDDEKVTDVVAKYMYADGRSDFVEIIFDDRLVACGIHEDCRASLDLAMACAEQRRAATHQVSVDRGPK